MTESIETLQQHKPQHDFLICIDSDGCAFDTMELKHKECFIPNTIKYWDLQPVSKYAREAAEFVNLYSKWRGVNRFPALTLTLDLLADWDMVQRRPVKLHPARKLRQWIEEESKLGNPALEAYCKEHDDEDMHRALAWSKAVNETVADIVSGGLPPFPYVRESLEKAGAKADMMVCSSTPASALQQEWEEQGLAEHVFAICGQEVGKKGQHIEYASKDRYPTENILMIGDAPGDRKAANQNGALFYPINPGDEDRSWQRFHDEALDKFLNREYAGDYQEQLIEEFEAYLPETPPWKRG